MWFWVFDYLMRFLLFVPFYKVRSWFNSVEFLNNTPEISNPKGDKNPPVSFFSSYHLHSSNLMTFTRRYNPCNYPLNVTTRRYFLSTWFLFRKEKLAFLLKGRIRQRKKARNKQKSFYSLPLFPPSHY